MSLFRKREPGDFNVEAPAGGKRFVKTYSQGQLTVFEIWVDTVTGVNYLYRENGNSGGLTVLVDREGRPVITAVHN